MKFKLKLTNFLINILRSLNPQPCGHLSLIYQKQSLIIL